MPNSPKNSKRKWQLPNRTKERIAPPFSLRELQWRILISTFFFDGLDILDDGFDHEDEYGDGFHEFDPEEEMIQR